MLYGDVVASLVGAEIIITIITVVLLPFHRYGRLSIEIQKYQSSEDGKRNC
jgi:hypothetical protein